MLCLPLGVLDLPLVFVVVVLEVIFGLLLASFVEACRVAALGVEALGVEALGVEALGVDAFTANILSTRELILGVVLFVVEPVLLWTFTVGLVRAT